MTGARFRAVFFDVDFTLIYPGPTFQGEGYARFGAAHGMRIDPARFGDAVRIASSILNDAQEHIYNDDIFIRYTARIIEEMGGTGSAVEVCAAEIYREWAACQHFHLYDDVMPALRELSARGLKVGLISNSHRSLVSFQEHFSLDGLIHGAISSSEHGYLKPHPSIFEAALTLLDVEAAESVMVGDSYAHDIEGARAVGMHGVLVVRSPDEPFATVVADVPVIRDLSELVGLL
jgi:HAD superfamily hydrolase (TIGR01662 family)